MRKWRIEVQLGGRFRVRSPYGVIVATNIKSIALALADLRWWLEFE